MLIKRIPEFFYRLIISRKLNSKEILDIRKPFYLIGEKYIRIGKKFAAKEGTRIEAYDSYNGKKYYPNIEIENNVVMGYRCHIGAIGSIKICDNCLIGSDVTITDHNHGMSQNIEDLKKEPGNRDLYTKGDILIKRNVWIGDKATILSGVTIGESSVIGANCVVTKSIPDYSIVVGNPARIIKVK